MERALCTNLQVEVRRPQVAQAPQLRVAVDQSQRLLLVPHLHLQIPAVPCGTARVSSTDVPVHGAGSGNLNTVHQEGELVESVQKGQGGLRHRPSYLVPMPGPMIWLTTIRLQGICSLFRARIKRALSFTPSTAERDRRARETWRAQARREDSTAAAAAVLRPPSIDEQTDSSDTLRGQPTCWDGSDDELQKQGGRMLSLSQGGRRAQPRLTPCMQARAGEPTSVACLSRNRSLTRRMLACSCSSLSTASDWLPSAPNSPRMAWQDVHRGMRCVL